MPKFKIAVEGWVTVEAEHFREAYNIAQLTATAFYNKLDKMGEYADVYSPEPELQEEED
jgi:hypothetical protein